ncbi:MAG: hypothetical protein UZ07_CHB004002680, partial [Chlorobi bacterium OLB7]
MIAATAAATVATAADKPQANPNHETQNARQQCCR